MSENLHLKAVEEELAAVGISADVHHGGKHKQVRWSHLGQSRQFVVPSTPSDIRGHLNTRTDIRRILRDDGLIVEEPAANAGDAPRLFLRDGVFFCTSRDVAAHFSRQHREVLRSIDRILEDLPAEYGRCNLAPSSYINMQNKQQREFNLSRDGFTLLAMGFTGVEAMKWKVKYLETFNAMQAELTGVAALGGLNEPALERIRRLESDVAGLIELSVDSQVLAPKPGYRTVKAHYRKIRAAA